MKTLLIVLLSSLLFYTAWTRVNDFLPYADKIMDSSDSIESEEEVKNPSDLSASSWWTKGTQSAGVNIVGMASYNDTLKNKIFIGASNGDFNVWEVQGLSQGVTLYPGSSHPFTYPVKKYTSLGRYFYGQTSKEVYEIRMDTSPPSQPFKILEIEAPNTANIVDFLPFNSTTFIASFDNGTLAQIDFLKVDNAFLVLDQTQSGSYYNKISIVNHLGVDYWVGVGPNRIHHGRLYDGKDPYPTPFPLPFFSVWDWDYTHIAISQDEDFLSIFVGSTFGYVLQWVNFGPSLLAVYIEVTHPVKEMKIITLSNKDEFLYVAFDSYVTRTKVGTRIWHTLGSFTSEITTFDVNYQMNPTSSFSLKGDTMIIVGLANGTMVYYNENALTLPTFMDTPAACGKPVVTKFFSLWYLSINQFLTVQLIGSDRRTACFLNPLSNATSFNFLVPAGNPTTEVYTKKVMNYNNLTLDGWSQQKSGWCWASTISGVMYFYGSGAAPANFPTPLPSYCALATQFGSRNRDANLKCCFQGINKNAKDLYLNLKQECKGGDITAYNDVLGLWGYPSLQQIPDTINWTAITREIDNNRPIMLNMCKPDVVCHSITLLGYQKSLDPARHDLNRVLIYDSSPKSDFYNEFADTYLTLYELKKYVGFVAKMGVELTWTGTSYNSIQSYQPPTNPEKKRVFRE